MIILDFLFYYLVYFFERNKDKLKWSTPVERAAYAMGLATMALIFSIDQFLIYKNIIATKYDFSKIIFLIVGLGIIKLYSFIYDKRYQYLLSSNNKILKLDKDLGANICIAFVFISILSPFIIIAIFG